MQHDCHCAFCTHVAQIIWSLYLGELILTLTLQVLFSIRLQSSSKKAAAAYNASLHQCAGSTFWTNVEIDALAITQSLRSWHCKYSECRELLHSNLSKIFRFLGLYIQIFQIFPKIRRKKEKLWKNCMWLQIGWYHWSQMENFHTNPISILLLTFHT